MNDRRQLARRRRLARAVSDMVCKQHEDARRKAEADREAARAERQELLEEIGEAIARTFWLCAYADGIENGAIIGPDVGPQEDWDDVAPPTPDDARRKARALIEEMGPMTVEVAAHQWMAASGLGRERFGSCLAFQALGHGVGLFDDIPSMSDYVCPRVPHGEFNIHDVHDLPKGVEWLPPTDKGEGLEVDGFVVHLYRNPADEVLTVEVNTEAANDYDLHSSVQGQDVPKFRLILNQEWMRSTSDGYFYRERHEGREPDKRKHWTPDGKCPECEGWGAPTGCRTCGNRCQGG